MEKLAQENEYKNVELLFGAAYADQIKAQQFYTDSDSYQQC